VWLVSALPYPLGSKVLGVRVYVILASQPSKSSCVIQHESLLQQLKTSSKFQVYVSIQTGLSETHRFSCQLHQSAMSLAKTAAQYGTNQNRTAQLHVKDTICLKYKKKSMKLSGSSASQSTRSTKLSGRLPINVTATSGATEKSVARHPHSTDC